MKPDFVLSLGAYENRYYTSVKTAVRGVLGWGHGYPDQIRLYPGRGVQVDWAAFDAWRAKYGVQLNSLYPPGPVHPAHNGKPGAGFNFSQITPAQNAQYEADLKEWEKECKAISKALHSEAEADLAAVFI